MRVLLAQALRYCPFVDTDGYTTAGVCGCNLQRIVSVVFCRHCAPCQRDGDAPFAGLKTSSANPTAQERKKKDELPFGFRGSFAASP
jgi:hypothetical protein